MGGPAFSNSSFSAKSCCSEKLLFDLPNSFSPAFQQKAAVAVCNSNPKQYLNNLKDHVESSSANPRVHDQGPFSGPEFATGEALGGHMRRHRGGGGDNPTVNEKMNHHIPVVKKSRSRRIICLDVNVTPFEHDSIDWGSSNSSG